MAASITDFEPRGERTTKSSSGHDVCFYQGDAFPAEAAAAFLAESLRAGGGAVLLAGAEHASEIERELSALGVDVARAKRDDRLVRIDASAVVDPLTRGADARDIAERLIAPLLRSLRAHGPVRAVGEAVDILARRKHVDAAIAFEKAWNDVADRADFGVLCVYSYASFEHHAELRAVLDAHADARHTHRLGETQTAAERLLARAAEDLSSSLDLAKTIERVAKLAVGWLADWCLVDLVGDDGRCDRTATSRAEGEPVRASVDCTGSVAAAIARREAQTGRDADESLRGLAFRSFATAPLVVRGEAIGALTCLAGDRVFDPHEVWLVEQLAASTAAAIANARLFAAEQKARLRIGRMQEVTAALSRARTAHEVAEVACRIGSAAMEAQASALWLVRDGALLLVGSFGTPDSVLDSFRAIPLDREGLPATAVVRTGEAVWVENEGDYRVQAPAIFDDIAKAGRVTSYGAVPLLLDGRTVGVITFAHPAPHRYTLEERAFYTTLASHSSQALDRARLLDAERRSNERLRLLAAAGETLARSLELDALLRSLAEVTVPAFADWCVVDLVEGGLVRRLAIVHPSAERVAQAERLTVAHPVRVGDGSRLAQLIANGGAELAAHIDQNALRSAARGSDELEFLLEMNIVSAIVAPLVGADGERMGALSFLNAESQRRYDEDDRDLARELSRRVALAIASARLYRLAEEARRAAEEANRVKDEFLATVSHELRTPLNAIGGWAAIIAQQPRDPGAVAKGVEVITRNVKLQTKLVEDILDTSRIITGKLRIDPGPVDLLTVARDAIDVVRPSADAKRIALDLAPCDGPAVVMGDAQRLQQVVWNLASNAVKFTQEGGHAAVSVARSDRALVLTVQDDGPGIPPDFLPFVFERFRQADGSATRRFGGLGLGLAIVRHIVELHGGTVEAASTGRGATFRVTLPASSLEVADGARAGARGASILGARVLVVDDDDDTRTLLELMLADEGAVVRAASSVRDAEAELGAFAPDVIVSDIGMPEEDGYSFIRRVREGRGRQATTPAVALTAYARSEDRVRALTAGFNGHVLKPVDRQELVTMIANLRLIGKA